MTKMPTAESAGFSSEPTEYPDEYKPLYVPTKLLKPNSLNPRTDADIAADDELRQSIGIRGVETPLHVRPLAEPDEDGHRYEVYDGDRRLRAAINTKLAKVPVIIRQQTDDYVIEFGMVSTIRRGLNDAEKGRALLALQERFPFKYGTQREMARSLATSVATINRYIKATKDLDPEVQELIAPDRTTRAIPEGTIDGRTAYEIAKIDDKDRQKEIAHSIIDKGIKGHKAREFVASARFEPDSPIDSLVSRIQEAPSFIPTLTLTSDEYQLVKAGKKTTKIERSQRPGVKAYSKIMPLVQAEPLEVLDVYKRSLGHFKDEDAKREGFKTLEQLKESWIQKHGVWTDEEFVYIVQFRKV
jgi:ParB/RepB/Spo0J family partition protein